MKSKMREDELGNEWRNSRGKLHREDDLPALEYTSGRKCWFINGMRHREFGPAIIDDDIEDWILNGIKYNTPEEMPIKLFMAYCNWEYRKKNGI